MNNPFGIFLVILHMAKNPVLIFIMAGFFVIFMAVTQGTTYKNLNYLMLPTAYIFTHLSYIYFLSFKTEPKRAVILRVVLNIFLIPLSVYIVKNYASMGIRENLPIYYMIGIFAGSVISHLIIMILSTVSDIISADY